MYTCPTRHRQACLPEKGQGACSPSQLQALSVPGPARILYCRSQVLAGAGIVPACCPQLLALGIRDERPVTPRFMGQAGEASMLRGSLHLMGVFFSLLPHLWTRCYPSPPCSLPHLADGPALPCVLRATERGGQTACSSSGFLQRVARMEESGPIGMLTAFPIRRLPSGHLPTTPAHFLLPMAGLESV